MSFHCVFVRICQKHLYYTRVNIRIKKKAVNSFVMSENTKQYKRYFLNIFIYRSLVTNIG